MLLGEEKAVASMVPGTEVKVTVSGDAYLGQPEMRVLLDGKEIGGLRVAARHDIGDWQTLVFNARCRRWQTAEPRPL
jgi:hypothetical protein